LPRRVNFHLQAIQKMRFFALLFTFAICSTAQAQSILGKWKSVDDNTKEMRSIIEITSSKGNFSGKIIQLFPAPGEDKDPICDKCPRNDLRHNQKILGLEIIRGLKADGKEYSGGEILDPEDGKTYRLKMWIEDGNLKLRGYIGPFYRTQTWLPVS